MSKFEIVCDETNNLAEDVASGVVNVTLKAPPDSPLGRKLMEIQEELYGVKSVWPHHVTVRLDDQMLRRAVVEAGATALREEQGI